MHACACLPPGCSSYNPGNYNGDINYLSLDITNDDGKPVVPTTRFRNYVANNAEYQTTYSITGDCESVCLCVYGECGGCGGT
jgi:hypothetical protein